MIYLNKFIFQNCLLFNYFNLRYLYIAKSMDNISIVFIPHYFSIIFLSCIENIKKQNICIDTFTS